MPNTSATGGPLLPSNTQHVPLEDLALILVFQGLVVGMTGLDGSLVRPRWQPKPPNMPANDVSWCALGIQDQQGDTFAYIEHDGRGAGQDILQRNEIVEMLCSFYGPNAGMNASLVRDGLSIAQNREPLQLNGMGLISVEPFRAVPALINNQWYNRLDMPIFVRREILRTYPVLNILSAVGTITAEAAVETLVVNFNVQQ